MKTRTTFTAQETVEYKMTGRISHTPRPGTIACSSPNLSLSPHIFLMPVSTSAPTLHSEKESLAVETEKHSGQKYLYIPDTMETWPWPRNIHPYYEVVTTEADVWFKSFQLLTPEAQYAFDKCDFGRLASLVYPDASRGASSITISVEETF